MAARPPGWWARSSTVTSCPAPARWAAAARPPRPAPMTTTRISVGGTRAAPRRRGAGALGRRLPPRSSLTPGDEVGQLGQRLAGVVRDGDGIQRVEGLRGQALDGALDLLERAGVDQDVLDGRHVVAVEVGCADALERAVL